MPILTPKMITNRLDHSANCKLFLPFSEGSGSTFSDRIGDADYTDASATFETPHTATVGVGANSAIGSGLIIPAGGVVALIVGSIPTTSTSFNEFVLGKKTEGTRLVYNTNGCDLVTDDGGTVFAFDDMSTLTLAEDTFAMFILDQVEGKSYTYESLNGAAASLKASKTTGIPTGAMTFPAFGSIGSVAVRQPMYGAALYRFDSMPDTPADALDWCVKNWTNGVKGLPPQWA